MAERSGKAVKDGVEIIQGTPRSALTETTLFLKLWRVKEGAAERTRAALFMVRPGAGDYVVKELIPDMDLEPQAALDKTVAIAKRGDAKTIYLNADLTLIPKPRGAINA
jgi:hypothetical protein